MGSFYYTFDAAFFFFFFFLFSFSFLFFFNLGSFCCCCCGCCLHILCWIHFYLGSFSYTSHAEFVFMWRVSLTHPVLASFLSGEFLLHIPCWLDFYARSFSYTSRAGFDFLICGVFFIFLDSFSYTSRTGFIFIWGVSLTHPVLASFLIREFLLHIPCWLHFCQGTFSYTYRDGFICIWEVSLTLPMLALFFCGSFCDTSYAGFFLEAGQFLSHIPCWLHFYLGNLS